MRVSGYRKALEEAGLEIDERLIYRGDNRFSGGRDGANELLDTGQPFSAVFAGNDVMAVGAIREFQHLGIRVPGEVSVIGFDGIALGDYMTPALTTIEQPRYDAGSRAFSLLFDRIEERFEGGPRVEHLAIELVNRESTGPPPARLTNGRVLG